MAASAGGRPVWRLVAAMTILSALLTAGAVRAEVSRVVILPFTANAPKDISYLTKGIRDMLASRLAWEGRVQVVEPDMVAPHLAGLKQPYNDQAARAVGEKVHAQVVVFGAVTMLGQALSIDARVVRVGQGAPALTAFVQAPKEDEVIPQINLFAQRINAEIFRRPDAVEAAKRAESGKQGGVGGSTGRLTAARDEGEDDSHMSPLNPLFMKQLYGVQSDRFWRSPRINGVVNAVSAADVDMDGQIELIALLPKSLRIYRLGGDYFQLISELNNGPIGTYQYVDAGDFNGDGRPEIYVSCRNGNSMSSFVLSYEKGAFTYLAKGVPYHLRMQKNPWGQGVMVFGQKTAPNAPFYGPIYKMKWQDGDLVSDDEVTNLPDMTTIYNFLLADLSGSGGRPMSMISDNTYHLRVYNRSGEQLWMSDEQYNASSQFTYYKEISGGSGEDDVWYFHTRILEADLDGDNKPEAVVVRNSDPTGMLLGRMRMFNRGQLYSLSWNGMSMVENWRTPRISGYVSDYAIADVANSGQPALILAYNVKDLGGLIEKGFSYVVAYTIKPKAERASGEGD
ncbi:FG-GAP repeat domain-containing protein [Desulfarculus baarsii]